MHKYMNYTYTLVVQKEKKLILRINKQIIAFVPIRTDILTHRLLELGSKNHTQCGHYERKL